MAATVYDKINQALTWRRILAFNFVLILVLIVPLSVQLSKLNTESRTNAASEDVVASPTPLPNYPKGAPSVTRVSTFYGKPGDSVIIFGSNFGDYAWASKVYVGNVEVNSKEIVRWSNTVVEAQIPQGATTGKVWVSINGAKSEWNGKLMIYNSATDAKIGLNALSKTQASLTFDKANLATRGVVVLSHVTEPISIVASPYIQITRQEPAVDVLSKTMAIEFNVTSQLPRDVTQILTIEHPELGAIEILRAELYTASSALIPTYSEPFAVKLTQ